MKRGWLVMEKAYWLTNVLLEDGFRYEGSIVRETLTAKYNIRIADGEVKEITPASEAINDSLPQKDAKGLLMAPSFRDMHMHLDKTFYGGEWRAPTEFVSIFGRLEEEKVLLPQLLPVAEERAKKIIDLQMGNGTTKIRGQVNVDPIIEMQNVEAVTQALAAYDDKLDYELVAFPQHGLLRSDAADLVRQALKKGATHVGGVDPATVDEDIEKSLYTMFNLAVEGNAGVDLHIHDQGHLGLYTIKRLAAYTKEAGMEGKVTIGHGFGLGEVSLEEVGEIGEVMANAGIDLVSTVPFEAGFSTPPIPLLDQKGVKVSLANDSILDHWEAFGTGDMLYKASIMAERFSLIDEKSLSRTLSFVTGGKTALDFEGNRVWPAVGDQADAVFIEASCSAEAVARKSKRKATMYKGNITAGDL